jgi:NADPH:quinone reductase-like Zn-dependent oxidoreductase
MALHWIATRPGDLDVFELQEYTVPAPASGEVTVEVRAAGMNPADYKHVAAGQPDAFPKAVGYEVAGVLTAIGPGTEIASGGGAVGDEVLAFRVRGGWSTALTVPAKDVFAKPASIPFEQAANLLLAGTTASEMLHVTGVAAGETILVHGASGAVGVSVLQQAGLLGVRVIGTCSEPRFDEVRRFGGEPVAYGDGLEQRVRDLAPDGIAAALDTVGTDEAVDVSVGLVRERDRVVTIAARGRAESERIRLIAGGLPDSDAYRAGVRAGLIGRAAEGRLEVPMSRTFPLVDALEAAAFLRGQHPGGKLALIPSSSQ